MVQTTLNKKLFLNVVFRTYKCTSRKKFHNWFLYVLSIDSVSKADYSSCRHVHVEIDYNIYVTDNIQ